MPRQARKQSESGIYHVMLRGINRQQIFEDEEGKQLILKIANRKTAAEFQQLDAATRNRCLQKLHEKGMSIRQISRLTGVSKRVVKWNI